MGVGITELLPKSNITFEELKGKKIAVDSYNVLYQFLASIRQKDGTPLMDSKGKVTSHLQGLLSRTTNLMQKDIKLAFVFDGEHPELKIKELQKRTARKTSAEEKYNVAVEEEDIDSMYKYSKQFIKLTDDMVEESMELCKALGLPVIQAPSEAEAQCAFMCRNNDVWAVGSQDTDALIFESPRLLRNLTLSPKKMTSGGSEKLVSPQVIDLKETLGNLKINHDQLIYLAILVGTDFNPGGVKGFGPKKALKRVQELKSPEKIFKEIELNFNWKEIYNVFKKIPVQKKYSLEWKPINEKKIYEILVHRHEFSEERVTNTLKKFNNVEKKNQPSLNKYF